YPAAQAGGLELQVDRAVEPTNALAQEPESEALVVGSARTWSAALDPVQVQSIAGFRPGDVDSPLGNGESAVLRGVGGELVNEQRDERDEARRTRDGPAAHRHPRQAERGKLARQDLVQGAAVPIRLQKEIMGRGKRADPGRKLLARFALARQRLRDDRLHQ